MDEQNRNNLTRDPWEPDFYETGRTRPPKNYGCLVALMLGFTIFLGGIVSALSLLNIRLFSQSQDKDPDVSSVQFLSEDPTAFSETAASESTGASEITVPTVPSGSGNTLQLNQSPASVENVPQEGGLSLQEIYSKAIPSVVSISCTLSGSSSSGTGVILTQDGYIITNAHVVEDALSIQVKLTDDRIFSACLVGSDTISDLAVLYIEADGLTPAEFGDSGALRVGDAVAAIGDPLGSELRGTMTDGIVSAINRDITTGGRTMTLIQTNAALNAGNSGGPLLNCYGQVIGINTMKIGDYMSSSGVEGLGFAIPSAAVKEVVDQLLSQGYVSGRPSLGLSAESIPLFYQHLYHYPAGLFITGVDPDSDAAAKGVEAGDILLSFNGTRVTDTEELETLLYACEVSDTVEIVIYRRGMQGTFQLTLGEYSG